MDELPEVDKTKVIVFGRSLGGAVALSLAQEHDTEVNIKYCAFFTRQTFYLTFFFFVIVKSQQILFYLFFFF